MHRYLKKVAFLGTLLASPSVMASPVFPATMQEELNMSCPPTCTVCHTVDPGEAGTASQPFALWMVGSGQLVAQDEKSLKNALETLASALPDTDGDGVDDLTELTSAIPSNPNDPNSTPATDPIGICDAEFNYGCGATIVRPNKELPDSSWFALSLLGLGAVAFRRARVARKS